MRRQLHRSLLLCLAIVFTRSHLNASAIERHLRDQYKSKFLFLRNFPAGEKLTYNSEGSLINVAKSGDWTTDGMVRVLQIRIVENHLLIYAARLWLSSDHGFSFSGFLQKKVKKEDADLQIDAELESGSTFDRVEATLSKIFLTSRDDFGELVPEYWKPCVLSALNAAGASGKLGCKFSHDFLRIPGVVLHEEKIPMPLESPGTTARPILQLGEGIIAPIKIYGPEPKFSEEARKSQYHGSVELGVIVDEAGAVTKVWIFSPLGYGLDQAAVDAVRAWKFKPALRDNTPVSVEIALEVSFNTS